MKATILLASTIWLAGCAATPPPPKIIEVKISVPVPCVKEIPAKPAVRSNSDLLAMREDGFIDALHADRLALIGYSDKLAATLEACR